MPEGVTPSQSKFLRALNDYGTLCRLVEDRGGVIRTITAPLEETLCRDLSVRVLAPSVPRAQELQELLEQVYAAEGDSSGPVWTAWTPA